MLLQDLSHDFWDEIYSRFDDSFYIKSNNEPWHGYNHETEDRLRDAILTDNFRLFFNLLFASKPRQEISLDVVVIALQHHNHNYMLNICNTNTLRWPNPKNLTISYVVINALFVYGLYICPAIIIKTMWDTEDISDICRMLRTEYVETQEFIKIMKIVVDQPRFYTKVLESVSYLTPDENTTLLDYAIECRCYTTADIILKYDGDDINNRAKLESRIQHWTPELNHLLTYNTTNIVTTIMTLRTTDTIWNVMPVELCFIIFSYLLSIQ